MGYSLQGPAGLELEVIAPAGLHSMDSNKTGFRLKPVSIASLATLEIPLLAIILMIAGISIAVAPDSTLRGSGIELPSLWCPVYELTHIPCLFCGLTRSFMAVGGLDLGQAFIFHPLGPIIYAVMFIIGAAVTGSIFIKRRIVVSLDHQLRKNLVTIGTATVIAAWFIKLLVWNNVGLL